MHGIGLRREPQWKLEKKRDVQANAFFYFIYVFSNSCFFFCYLF